MPHKEATAVPKRFSIQSVVENGVNPKPDKRQSVTKWNSFSGVEAAHPGFLDEAMGKGSVRRCKGITEFTAKMGHCPEVEGNCFLIHRVIFPPVPRLPSNQPELVVSLRVAAYKFRLIRNRIRPVLRRRLDKP